MLKNFFFMLFILFLGVFSCSKVKPEKELLVDIQTLEKQEKIAEAIDLIETFIKHYPESESTPNFTSKLADLYILAHKDYHHAIEIHNQVIKKYPGSKLEVRSQFMIGYIYANELGELENARTAYTEFLRKFPNDELAPSVKWEIDNLGVDISQIPIASDEKDADKEANGTSKK
ncbi:MAG: tetratricopeptide repeat protein [Deferribacteres bacterium]|nr:tetratricopeptide repeat protein [candidate division KSB1 bacterium]MCB9500766.1 tetratricopeptide repeat protein [Deferribacteres bacterium]